MKRASITLFLCLTLAAGLAFWLHARPQPRDSAESTPPPSQETQTSGETAHGLESAADSGAQRLQAEATRPAGLERAQTSASSGSIVGWTWKLVEKRKQSLESVDVALWLDSGTSASPAATPPLRETKSGAMGSFRFSELAPGRYFAGVLRGGSLRQFTQVDLAPGALESIEFVIGSARLEGVAYALDGDEHPALELERLAPRGRVQPRWPDEKGRFAFDDLPAGRYELRARWRSDRTGMPREDSSRIDLADGVQRRYDAGGPTELPRWRGEVRLAIGVPPLPGARLRFQPYVPEDLEQEPAGASDEDTDPTLQSMQADPFLFVYVSLDERGRFDVALPPRRWMVSLEFGSQSGSGKRLGDALIEGGTLSRDLACPGSRIRGRVLANGQPLAAKDLRVLARRMPAQAFVTPASARVDGHGVFVFDALRAGEWSLELDFSRKEWTLAPVRVQLGEDGQVLEQDLELRKR